MLVSGGLRSHLRPMTCIIVHLILVKSLGNMGGLRWVMGEDNPQRNQKLCICDNKQTSWVKQE